MKPSRLFTGPVAFALVFALLLASSGCRQADDSRSMERTSTLHVGLGGEPEDLDPHTNISATAVPLMQLLFEGLLRPRAAAPGYEPGAAESWKISSDGLVYTFRLREGLRWSNGDPVLAGDFRAGYLRLLSPLLASDQSGFHFMIEGAEAFATGKNPEPDSVGVRALDERTIEYRLRHPSAYALRLIGSVPPCHAPTMEKFQAWTRRGAGWTKPGRLVGNGPYALAEWLPNQHITLVQNASYWDRARLAVEAFRFIPFEDPATLDRAYRGGQLHLAPGIAPARAAEYRSTRPEELRMTPGSGTQFLTFNTLRVPYQDVRVRRALALAIDRDEIVRALRGPDIHPALSLLEPGFEGYTPELPAALATNVEEARRLLAEAGFPEGRGFPTLEMMCPVASGPNGQIAQIIQARWKEVLGVLTEIRSVEFKTYIVASRNREFSLALGGWQSALDPVTTYRIMSTGNPNNDAQWSNAEFDRVLDLAEREADPATRTAHFSRLEAIMAEEMPQVPINHRNLLWLVHPRVQNFTYSDSGMLDYARLALAPAP
jgi:oligopeptide transport system substrate-binding protein